MAAAVTWERGALMPRLRRSCVRGAPRTVSPGRNIGPFVETPFPAVGRKIGSSLMGLILGNIVIISLVGVGTFIAIAKRIDAGATGDNPVADEVRKLRKLVVGSVIGVVVIGLSGFVIYEQRQDEREVCERMNDLDRLFGHPAQDC